MSFFKGKFESLSNMVSDAVATGKEALSEAKDKSVEYSQKVSESAVEAYSSTRQSLSEVVETASSSALVVATKEKVTLVSDGTVAVYETASFNIGLAYNSSSEAFGSYIGLSSERVSSYFKRSIEVDKDTDQIIAEIQGRLPARPKDVDHIFEQTKQEALRRAISSFCLAPLVSGLDERNEEKYSDLSVEYKDHPAPHRLTAHINFMELKKQRDSAKVAWAMLENGYDTSRDNTLFPTEADIEHIIPKKAIYDDLILRIANNDKGIVDAMNFKQNLMFADESFNGSKGDTDLLEYIKQNGTPDPSDPDKIDFVIGVHKKSVRISKSDAEEKYEAAQKELAAIRREAMKEIGFSVANAGARMAAQQVVGVIVGETVDIFVDEIKDITQRGLITDKQGVLDGLEERSANLYSKLSLRFEERKLVEQARAAGVEGGIAGVLSAIPQILISMLVKLPALVLSIIRECTLSTVRCVRVLLSNAEDKYDKVSIVLFGAASTVIGLYVANFLSKALVSVPLLNLFNHSVADVLTGVLVTAVPLAAIYVFDQNKTKFIFTKKDEHLSPDQDPEPILSPA